MTDWEAVLADAQKGTRGITSLLPQQLQALMQDLGQPRYRAGQVFGWLHQNGAQSYDEMTNLPISLRRALAAAWPIEKLDVVKTQRDADGTAKLLVRLPDGHHVETVVMQYHHGLSVCVSSQVGCRMGCRFCASTVGGPGISPGLVRGLTAGEMAAQVYAAARLASTRASHVVLMGIGEPLDNYDEVLQFIRIITHPDGCNLSARGVSLSTCGVVGGIQRLAQEKLGITLSVSLHASGDDTRSALMPVNNAWPLVALLKACEDYQAHTGRRVSYEYAMIDGVNDSEADADRLAGLFHGKGAHLNLIPMNAVPGTPYRGSARSVAEAFARRLQTRGVNTTIRRRLGADIDAACGQLRARGE